MTIGAGIRSDLQPEYEFADPKKGVSPIEAFYHFIDKPKGKRLIELHLGGYSDPANRDRSVSKEESIVFGERRQEWSQILSELEPELMKRLRSGDLLPGDQQHRSARQRTPTDCAGTLA